MTALLAVRNSAVRLAFVYAALISSGYGAQDASGNPRRNGVAANVCRENEFACQDGSCIRSELLCDGRADCSDKSDETQAACGSPEFACQDYAFRCSYGACVNGDAACNGIKDCLDNSDELLPRCPGVSATNAGSRGNCPVGDHRCNDGSCINSTSLCDGTIECADGSDESFESCGSFPCGQLYFRCNYGACIDGDLGCNGVINCADGSDEDPLLCNRPLPTPRIGEDVSVPSTSPGTRRFCIVPPQPPNGLRKLHRNHCQNGMNCDISQGVSVDPGSRLVYSCNPGFKISGYAVVFCSQSGDWSEIPNCSQITCSSLESVSRSANCIRSNKWTPCNSTVLPNTRVILNCRPGYEEDTDFSRLGRRSVECNEDGTWSPRPIDCSPLCGIINTRLTPTILNGTAADITEFPWHASLYRQESPPLGPKEYICGATIIQDNLLLTAAHCVYDDEARVVESPGKFYVATGNRFRDYDSPLHQPHVVKKSAVKNIYLPCGYYGFEGNYVSDIALLELREPFQLSNILMPACIDVGGTSQQILEAGSIGKFAGFGGTATGMSSALLLTTNISLVSFRQCRQTGTRVENRALVGHDKICGEGQSGMAVCKGDSGGGLVFDSVGSWHVMGVLSVSLGRDTSTGVEIPCSVNSYALYTKLSTYMPWIRDVLYSLKHGQVYSTPPCGTF